MADFNVRSDSVNVEHVMEQIRARISEKRGVDYTEQQIRELAAVRLERFLDPRGVRSDLLDQFRKAQPAYEPPELPNFAFEDETLFESHRGPVRWIRKLLLPLLKLFFNPNPLIQALHIQSHLNTMNAERDAKIESARRAMDQLYYELIHNLVIETTRLGIEVKNLKMRVESVSSRLEFNERRARALEGVVVYKSSGADELPVQRAPASATPQPFAPSPPSRPVPLQPVSAQPAPSQQAPVTSAAPAMVQGQPTIGTAQGVPGEGPGQRSRRRRRRRGRRSGGTAAEIMGLGGSPAPGAPPDTSARMDSTDAVDHDAEQQGAEPHGVEPGGGDRDRAEHDEAGDTRAVAAEDVGQPAGRASHPSEPPADSGPVAPTEPGPAPTAASGQGGSDPDSQ
jgi:hypothetical protein